MLNLELPTVAPRKVKPVKSKTGRVKVRVSCFKTVKKKTPTLTLSIYITALYLLNTSKAWLGAGGMMHLAVVDSVGQ